MAYAALRSLQHTIMRDLPIEYYSAMRACCSLRRTLDKCSAGLGDLDEQIIIEAAIKLEDSIEFCLLSQPPTFSLDFDDHIHCFVQTAKKRIQIIEGLWKQKKVAKMIEENAEPDPEEDVEMVGLCDQFLQIRDYLLSERLRSGFFTERVIWISGMAGVGKTALAKKVFHHPSVKAYFQSRAFIRVGLKSTETILQAIIDQLNLDNGGLMTQNSLIFLDDVWDPDSLYSLFSETRFKKVKGIVVLVTSRTDSPEHSFRFRMKMRFMNEKESWELLRRKVFGEEEECPRQLVKPGKKIAEKCEGLPFLINAVAPILLSQAHKDPECWNRVAHKPDSLLEKASHQISQVLLKSYNQITEDDKLCFLYIASFPLSCVVTHSTIFNLWQAEGLGQYYGTYKDFINKNIVIDCQKSWSEAEAFRLHCSYWYVNKRVAENNKFLYIIRSWADDLDESIKSHRRLAIQENVL